MSVSICLKPFLITGFLAIKIAEYLSLCISGIYLSMCPRFLQIKCDNLISTARDAKDARVLYSDSALDLEIVLCFFND